MAEHARGTSQGDLVARIRDVLLEVKAPDELAVRAARHLVARLGELQEHPLKGPRASDMAEEVSRDLAELIERAVVGVPEDVSDYETAWREVRATLGVDRQHMARWRELVPFYAAEVFSALLEAGRVESHVWNAAFWGFGITQKPPVVHQEAAGEPVVVWYWCALEDFLRAAELAAPDWFRTPDWLSLVESVEDNRVLGLEADYRPEIELRRLDGPLGVRQRFGLAFKGLSLIFSNLEEFVRVQWVVAEIVGQLSGRDDVGFHWYDYAQRFQWQRKERQPLELDALLAHWEREPPAPTTVLAALRRASQEVFRWEEALDLEPGRLESYWVEDEPFTLAAQAIRYLLDGEPFDVPVIATRDLLHPDAYLPFRLVVNHPYVSQQELLRIVRENLKAARRPEYRRDLNEAERGFIEAVREARAKAGIGEDARAPTNFWREFQRQWNRAHPRQRMSVNHLRVRFHRLSERSREHVRGGE